MVAAASGSPLHLDRHRIDLGRWVARSIVDLAHCVGVRRFRHAPDHSRIGVAPCALEVHALIVLDIEISLMRRLQRLGCYAMHPVMDVHELRHSDLLLSYLGDSRSYTRG